jgi:hypothetical protein
VIDHSLTFIGWPIDLGHNLLYFVVAVFLTVQMGFVDDPVGWFALSTAAVLATLTIAYDLRLVRRRFDGASGAAAELYATVLSEQRWQLRLSPVFVLVPLVPLVLLVALPGVFLDRDWHVALIVVQLLAVGGALARAVRSFTRTAEPIVGRAIAELEPEAARLDGRPEGRPPGGRQGISRRQLARTPGGRARRRAAVAPGDAGDASGSRSRLPCWRRPRRRRPPSPADAPN